MKTFSFFLMLSLFLVACKEQQTVDEQQIDTEAEGKKLMQLSREWSKSASGDNVEKTLSYWADDAVVMQPGQPIIRGKQEIRAMLESTSNITGFQISWEPQEVHVSKDGDMAYMIERNKVSFTDSLGNPVTETNKVTTVWRKQPDGSWKNVVDMWNADPPVSSQKAASK